MSARYEITLCDTRVEITDPWGCVLTIYDGAHEMTVGAIRQQSADIAALKDALADEVTANEAFRKAGGARDDEDMPTFCARLIAERDKYRGQAAAMIERMRESIRRALYSWDTSNYDGHLWQCMEELRREIANGESGDAA